VTETLRCDLCVIGAGAGGLTLAAGASQMGASVVLIERDRMGGECLYTGCVPSKALLAAAARGESFADAYAHVGRVVEAIAPHDSRERFEGLGVRVIGESARFTGRRSVTAGNYEIRARRFVIATGSRPVLPAIDGIEQIPALTNETLFSEQPTPSHLLVLGGGPAGIEMAQAFRRLGAEVSLVEAGGILPRDDPELVAVIRDRLIAEGIRLHEQCEAIGAATEGGAIRLSCKTAGNEMVFSGSHLFVAAGRRANIDGLGLEAAGVALRGGALELDSRLRTGNKRIFAIGDAAGPHRFTHMAAYQAGIVLRNALFRLPAKADYRAVPWATYCDPELAHVGLSEEAARRAGVKHQVLRHSYAENNRALADGRTEGMIKLVVAPGGRVLGASIVGAQAGELIHAWCLAVARRLKVSAVAQTVTPYPTLSEIGVRAAGGFYAPKLFSARTKRLVRFLQRLG
jgi:pyruvate/2-oxoglutarate dehydrogenase complex dihydrolipoamide dehydrogenase (E3) component